MNIEKQSGFTLIELLIVITIIGILSAIVIISLGSSDKFAKDGANKAELAQLNLIAAQVGETLDDDNFCDGGDGKIILDSVAARIGGTRSDKVHCKVGTNDAWAVLIDLLADNANQFCIDSTGIKKRTYCYYFVEYYHNLSIIINFE